MTVGRARNTSITARKRAKKRPSSSQKASQKNPSTSRTDRRHPRDRASDQRSSSQRDRDRVLYSSAFRRLAGVTQVVHAAEGHIFHNRLTHTLKVAQVGHRLAELLLETEPQESIDAVGGIDPNVVETAALAHDLGHPPFGHIAEQVLDEALKGKGVADGYEGNAQSFRIVTKVAIKSLDYTGLNLTRASLNAILKYPWPRNVAGKEHSKWGYYYSEKDDFDFARALMTSSDRRQSVEAALMDWADDVTYSVHDVDDFYRAGLIPLDRILLDTEERDLFIENVYDRWENEKGTSINVLPPDQAKTEFFGKLAKFVDELLVPFKGSQSQRAELNFLSSLLIRRYVVGAPQEGIKAVNLTNESESFVQIEPRLRVEVDLLKELMRYYVFENPALLSQQYGQRIVVNQLFEILHEAAKPNSKNQGLIPYPFSDSLKKITGSSEQSERERARLVADLIASMTEQQALLLHQRLTGIAPGSVRDLIIR